MFKESLNRIFGYRHSIHLLNLLSHIGDHIFIFIGLNIAISAGIYFAGIAYSHQAYMTVNLVFIIFIFTLLLSILIPLTLFMLACCEMFAEYLACLLFPRQK